MKRLTLFLLAFALLFAGCSPAQSPPETTAPVQVQETQELKVYYIDVGQADSILITLGEHSMLIDAGNNDDGKAVVDFIADKGISKLDIVAGTHPHEDHIGGLDDVINAFDIGEIIMPKISHTTKTYKDVLTAIKNKNLTVTAAKAGQTYSFGSANIQVISPVKDKYENLNQYSAVIRLTYKNTAFLFTGDMEKTNEDELLASSADVKADVLKVAHHGSRTSSTSAFLSAVSPQYAIICVGKDNSYKHPHANVLSRLENTMTVYRTDMHGTITVTSDGQNISVHAEKQEEKQ